MPRLVVVPTPIGNLEDITLRALRVLRETSIVLAEDTRHTAKLLRHFGIDTPLLSYHQHNKRSRLPAALHALEKGDVALASSAGMPAIADPGFELVVAAIEAGIEVDVLPGPNAAITAVVLAALPAPGFIFVGFLPRRGPERRMRLTEIASLPYSIVLYEAPHRLQDTLRDVQSTLGNRAVVLARELTKVHQETVRGTVASLLERYAVESPRGEFTLVVEGARAMSEQVDRSEEARAELRRRRARKEDARAAMAEVGLKYGLSRNRIYRLWLESAPDLAD